MAHLLDSPHVPPPPSPVLATRRDRRRTAKRRSAADRIGHALLTLVLVVLAALVTALVVVPRLTGSVSLTVLTGSMQPALDPGDMIVVRPTDPAALQVGDVVTFQPRSGDPTLVTHRIVEIQREGRTPVTFITQGDANGVPDTPLQPGQVQGRLWYSVPLVGHVVTRAHPLWVPLGAGVLLMGYGLVLLLRPSDPTSAPAPVTEPAAGKEPS